MSKPLHELSIAEAGKALRAGTVTSVALTQHALSRIGSLRFVILAFSLSILGIATIIAALALNMQPASAPTAWEPMGEDGAGSYAIDPASIARDGDVVRFLLRATAAHEEADGTSWAVVRYEIDCRRRTVAAESADFYRQDGSLVHTRHRGAGWGERPGAQSR